MKIKLNFAPKLILVTCSIILSQIIQAQDFNKTYPQIISGSHQDVTVKDIITDGLGYTYTLSYSAEYIFITMLDFSGNVIFAKASTRLDNDWLCTPYKIIQRPNAEFIVVGLAEHTGTHIKNPYASLYNSTGNHISTKLYLSNSTVMQNIPGFTRVNIIKTAGDVSSESYIITAPAPQDINGSFTKDIVVNAIKIDASLNSIWNNKYMLTPFTGRGTIITANPTVLGPGDPVSEHEDYPQALEYVSNGGDKYVIAGTAHDVAAPVSGPSYFYQGSFIFSINSSGSIVNNYQVIVTPGYPFGHNLLLDGNDLVMTFTKGNTNFFGATVRNPSSVAVSQIAVMKFDPISLSVPSGIYDFYYLTGATENYAFGIAKNDANNGYVIPVFIAVNGSAVERNIGILEISNSVPTLPALNNVNYFHIFNRQTLTQPAAIVKNSSSSTNYVIAGQKDLIAGAGDLRVISTDINGITCGYEAPSEGQAQYCPFVHSYSYGPTSITSEMLLNLADVNVGFDVDDCYNSTNSAEWKRRPASIKNMKRGEMKAYPTVFHQQDNVFTVELNSVYATNINVELYNIDGRKISETKHAIKAGDNTVQSKIALPAPGNYTIRVQSHDAQLSKVFKVTSL